MTRPFAALLALGLLCGCPAPLPQSDSGREAENSGSVSGPDGGSANTGGGAGATDGDGGSGDGGPADGGTMGIDAGTSDGGVGEADGGESGTADAGGTSDAGEVSDAGNVPDAGSSPDAGCDCPAAPANGIALCLAGICDFECSPGFSRCGAECRNDVGACGPLCLPCPSPGPSATTSCVRGVCESRCSDDAHLCGSSCVANTSVTQCGSGCVACSAPINGVPSCDAGTCDFGCLAGFHRCGSECVVDDPAQCGPSCSACPGPSPGSLTHPTCELGICGISCVESCGTSCVNRQVDTANCGSCGHSCSAAQRCSRGRCVTPCPNGIDFEGLIPLWGSWGRWPAEGVLQVADLDGDGINDLFKPGEPSDRGLGRGRFVSWGPSPDLAADVDMDGELERVTGIGSTTTHIAWIDGGAVALSTPAARQIRVAHGTIFESSATGLGTLALNGGWTWIISGEDVADFIVQDLDLDGVDDFIVRTGPANGPWQLTLRRGLGDGGVAAGSIVGSPSYTSGDMRDLNLFDFTGDGVLDIVTRTRAFFGLSDGGFELHDFFGSFGPGVPFDVDGDGRKEWVHARARVLMADSPEVDGGIRQTVLPLFTRVQPTVGYHVEVQALGVGDVNNDGVADLVYQTVKGDGSAVLGTQGGLVFPQSFDPSFFVLADVTRDGSPDLVLPGAVWVNNGSGQFGSPMSIPTANAEMMAADLNGDGTVDIIQSDRVFLSNGSSPFASLQLIPTGAARASADFNRDGRMDILQVFPSSATARVLFQQADAGFEIGPVIAATNPLVADVNLDSWPDLLSSSTAMPPGTTWKANTRGTFVERPILGCWDLETFADFDRDGLVDLGCRATTGAWSFAHGSGNGDFVAALPTPLDRGQSGSPPAVGDFDGDGNLDLAYGFGLVHRGHGDGTFGQGETWAPFDSLGRVSTARDIDDDGHDDLIISASPAANGTMYVLRSICR